MDQRAGLRVRVAAECLACVWRADRGEGRRKGEAKGVGGYGGGGMRCEVKEKRKKMGDGKNEE